MLSDGVTWQTALHPLADGCAHQYTGPVRATRSGYFSMKALSWIRVCPLQTPPPWVWFMPTPSSALIELTCTLQHQTKVSGGPLCALWRVRLKMPPTRPPKQVIPRPTYRSGIPYGA
jgi:hypothetical protein